MRESIEGKEGFGALHGPENCGVRTTVFEHDFEEETF
jgi:hypothetical protein